MILVILLFKTKYQTDKTEPGNKIPDVTNFVKKTELTELENKIPDVSSLATKTALTVVENKIPDVSSSVKKTDYSTRITEIENKLTDHNHYKYITTPEFNTLAASVFNSRWTQANLITKTDFDAKLSGLNKKVTANKTKHLLVENKLKKLKTITPSNYSVTPSLNYYGTKTRVEFYGGCLKQDKVTFNHVKVVNIYIVYEAVRIVNLGKHSSNVNHPTLENALFGAVSLTKNADIDKSKYCGYGIGFDRKSSFSFPADGLGKNVIIFGVDMSSLTKIDNRKKDIMILGKGLTQGLEYTLSAEKCIWLILQSPVKTFV